jgi:hypothetical protein
MFGKIRGVGQIMEAMNIIKVNTSKGFMTIQESAKTQK